jgi:hypothetical protein
VLGESGQTARRRAALRAPSSLSLLSSPQPRTLKTTRKKKKKKLTKIKNSPLPSSDMLLALDTTALPSSKTYTVKGIFFFTFRSFIYEPSFEHAKDEPIAANSALPSLPAHVFPTRRTTLPLLNPKSASQSTFSHPSQLST